MLAEELSPRIDLLDLWTDELNVLARQMKHLVEESDAGDRSAADRERRTKAAKPLRDLMLEVQAEPDELIRLARVIERRVECISRRGANWPRATCGSSCRSPRSIAVVACRSRISFRKATAA